MRTEIWSPVAKMTLAFWGAAFAVLTLRGFLMPDMFWVAIPPRLVTCVLGSIMCLGLAWASRPIRHFKIAAQLAIGLVAAAAASMVFSVIAELV